MTAVIALGLWAASVAIMVHALGQRARPPGQCDQPDCACQCLPPGLGGGGAPRGTSAPRGPHRF